MINLITYASHLSNQLTSKISEKLQQSVDDFFEQIKVTYKQDINYLYFNQKTLTSSKTSYYSDGSIKKSFDYWDLLNQEDKEKAISLMELKELRNSEVRKLRKYLLPLAGKCLNINNNVSTEYELKAFVKFFKCLPDFITQDKELLLRQGTVYLKEDELTQIEMYAPNVSQKELDTFVKENKNEEINNILSQLYALDFLVDF